MKDKRERSSEFKKPYKVSDENGSFKQTAQIATLQVSNRNTVSIWMYILLWKRREEMGYYSWRQEATFLFGLRKDPKISGGKETNILTSLSDPRLHCFSNQTWSHTTHIKASMHLSIESPYFDLKWAANRVNKGTFFAAW